MQGDTISAGPDWQAINAAHRLAEAMRLNDNARPVGALATTVIFEQVIDNTIFPVDDIPAVPRKTNGFDGRSKTHRASPYKPNDSEQAKPSLHEQFTRLNELRTEVEGEIEDPDRLFFTYIETLRPSGEIREEKEYIYDAEVIEEIKAQERAAMETVLRALGIDILEKHPRTKGFPGRGRIESPEDEDAYGNVAHLRSPRNQQSEDLLLQAMLTDLEKRLAEEPTPKARKPY